MREQRNIQSLCHHLRFDGLHGYAPTSVAEVSFFQATKNESSCPQIYESGIVFILEGYKTGCANGREFVVDKDNYLLLSNAYPVECQTFASPELPLRGLYVHFDMQELRRIADVMSQRECDRSLSMIHDQAMEARPVTQEVSNAVQQLVVALHDPVEAEILAKPLLSQIYYHLMSAPGGCVLKALAQQDSKLSRISSAMKYMEDNLSQKIMIEDLAEQVNMSTSAFHRLFKEATSESPLQYLKKIRLLKARHYIVYEQKPAYLAALEVGYESATQFSREFKRYFGVPPSKAKSLPYSDLIGVA